MNNCIHKFFLAMSVTCCALGASAAPVTDQSANSRTDAVTDRDDLSSRYNFRVFLDEKPIGYHQFDVNRSDAGKKVESEAQFDVKVLFITAFKYRHSSVERWEENCVAGIESKTSSNGKRQQVQGELVDDVLTIESSAGDQRMNGCVQTFAYWNPSILDATKLLNSQTGDYVDVEVVSLGPDTLTLGENQTDAVKYNLRSTPDYEGKPVDITLWYDSSGTEWLALESLAKGDRTLRYERTNAANLGSDSVASTGN
ncbi:MAG: DUF6134 family protein [Gammaproteobacteria bacterium]